MIRLKNMTLALDVRRFAEKSKADVATVARKSLLELGSNIVLRTPVDTGRLRGGWTYGIERPRESPARLDANGNTAISELAAGLDQWDMSVPFYFTNSVHYAQYLEYGTARYGFSQQAPEGFVRVELARFQQYFRDQLRRR